MDGNLWAKEEIVQNEQNQNGEMLPVFLKKYPQFVLSRYGKKNGVSVKNNVYEYFSLLEKNRKKGNI